MPVHDWTRVSAGTCHDFHNAWITHLKEALNAGLLPAPYYALSEQRSGDIRPDIGTLHAERVEEDAGAYDGGEEDVGSRLIAVAETPPHVRLLQEADEEVACYLERRSGTLAEGNRRVMVIPTRSPPVAMQPPLGPLGPDSSG